jgi:Gp49-like protein DUF891
VHCVAARGSWGTVEWAATETGDAVPAKAEYDALDDNDRPKVLALFQRLAEYGRISNREKFRQLGQKAGKQATGFWEFKSFQDRFIGDFKPGCRFIIGAYTRKKKDKLDKQDIDRAVKALATNDHFEEQQKKAQKDDSHTHGLRKV